jgi:IS1 family transposase
VNEDERLLAEARERQRWQKLHAELEHAGALAEAADQAEAAARTLRDHAKAKLVRIAGSDSDLRQRLLKLANKSKGIYAEALAELGN